MLGDDRRLEPQARAAPAAEAHDVELGGVRVNPAAVDVEARGNLAGGEQRVRLGVAGAQQLRDLLGDRVEARGMEARVGHIPKSIPMWCSGASGGGSSSMPLSGSRAPRSRAG